MKIDSLLMCPCTDAYSAGIVQSFVEFSKVTIYCITFGPEFYILSCCQKTLCFDVIEIFLLG